jgi:ribosomal protein S10
MLDAIEIDSNSENDEPIETVTIDDTSDDNDDDIQIVHFDRRSDLLLDDVVDSDDDSWYDTDQQVPTYGHAISDDDIKGTYPSYPTYAHESPINIDDSPIDIDIMDDADDEDIMYIPPSNPPRLSSVRKTVSTAESRAAAARHSPVPPQQRSKKTLNRRPDHDSNSNSHYSSRPSRRRAPVREYDDKNVIIVPFEHKWYVHVCFFFTI